MPERVGPSWPGPVGAMRRTPADQTSRRTFGPAHATRRPAFTGSSHRFGCGSREAPVRFRRLVRRSTRFLVFPHQARVPHRRWGGCGRGCGAGLRLVRRRRRRHHPRHRGESEAADARVRVRCRQGDARRDARRRDARRAPNRCGGCGRRGHGADGRALHRRVPGARQLARRVVRRRVGAVRGRRERRGASAGRDADRGRRRRRRVRADPSPEGHAEDEGAVRPGGAGLLRGRDHAVRGRRNRQGRRRRSHDQPWAVRLPTGRRRMARRVLQGVARQRGRGVRPSPSATPSGSTA